MLSCGYGGSPPRFDSPDRRAGRESRLAAAGRRQWGIATNESPARGSTPSTRAVCGSTGGRRSGCVLVGLGRRGAFRPGVVSRGRSPESLLGVLLPAPRRFPLVRAPSRGRFLAAVGRRCALDT